MRNNPSTHKCITNCTYSYNFILLNKNKEQNTNSHSNMDVFSMREWSHPGKGKSTETDNRLVVARVWLVETFDYKWESTIKIFVKMELFCILIVVVCMEMYTYAVYIETYS